MNWPIFTRVDEPAEIRAGHWAAIVSVEDGRARPDAGVWAQSTELNILDSEFLGVLRELGPRPPARIILPSGWLSGDRLERSARTWGPEGMRALEDACKHIGEWAAATGTRVLLRPHCRHVLGDVQRTISFLRAHQGSPVGLALEPCALLEQSMLSHAEDHLRSAFANLAPLADALCLSGVRFAADADSGEPPAPTRTTVGEGSVPPRVLMRLAHEHVPHGTPIILEPDAIEAQAAMLIVAR